MDNLEFRNIFKEIDPFAPVDVEDKSEPDLKDTKESVWAQLRKTRQSYNPAVEYRIKEITRSTEPEESKLRKLKELSKELADGRKLLTGTHAAKARGYE